MSGLLAVYKPGDLFLKTTIEGDKVHYSNLTLEEYKASLDPDVLILPIDDAVNLLRQEQDKQLITEWTKITKKQWDEALDCLPPEKWEVVNGVEFFRCCEYHCSNITSHYAHHRGKRFTALRRISTSYADLANEVKDKWHSATK